MLITLYFVFALLCILIFFRILKEFDTGFDFFSGALYGLIFLVSCGLLYVFMFGIYYWISEGL